MSAPARAVRRFTAMGCRAVVLVESPAVATVERVAERAMVRIARFEASWSRFLPDSDVSRLNRSAGAPVAVRAETVALLQAMAAATLVTDGAFDPTATGGGVCGPAGRRWVEHVAVDVDAAIVCVAAPLALDAGGLGKGLAADLVAAAALDDGASAAAVSLGGDVRVASAGGHHVVAVSGPDGEVVDSVAIADGGVATSGLRRPHLVDPATGDVLDACDPGRRTVQVSVLAGSGTWAEALTKQLLLAAAEDDVVDRLDRRGIGVLRVFADGSTAANDVWQRFRLPALAA